MDLTTLGPVAVDLTSLRTAIEKLGPSVRASKLIIVYLPIESDHESVLDLLAAMFPDVPVVGATTGGAAFTERGSTRSRAVIGFLGGPGVEVRVCAVENVNAGLTSRVGDAVRRLVSRPSAAKTSILSFADAFAVDGEELAGVMLEASPAHVRLFGGTAGDDWRFSGTRVFYCRSSLENAAVFALLSSPVELSMAVRHGWSPARGAADFIVTRCQQNKLLELDGRPALDVYTEELQRLGLLEPGADPVPVMATYELGLRTPFGNEYKIRAPLGTEGETVILASGVPNRTSVRIMSTNAHAMIAAAKDVASSVERANGCRGKLVFDCAARLRLLGDRYDEEVAAFLGSGNHPVLGVTCYGELARGKGEVQGFHNTTAVAVAW